MKWKQKALVQNIIAKLPSELSYELYYIAQRRFGGLRYINPVSRLLAGIGTINKIQEQNHDVLGKTFLEIGTGRRLNVPIALWLCGAAKIVTVDLNPYLKEELVLQDIAFIRQARIDIKSLFGNHAKTEIFQERFYQLIRTRFTLESLLKTINIEYLAPGDATQLALSPQSVDYHTSFAVFEHIPPQILEAILREGKRVVKQGGLFVHFIDFSDHFEQRDKSISEVNFLQFSDAEWDSYAGNRYMYQNRLRVDDYQQLFTGAELKLLSTDATVSPMAVEALKSGLPVHEKFKHKSLEINATVDAWIVASQE